MGNNIVACLSSDASDEVKDDRNLSRVSTAVGITLTNSRLEKEMSKNITETPYLFDMSPIDRAGGAVSVNTTTDSEYFVEEKPALAKTTMTVSPTSIRSDDCYKNSTEEESSQQEGRNVCSTTVTQKNLLTTESVLTQNPEEDDAVYEDDGTSDVSAKRSLSLMTITPGAANLSNLTTDSVKQILLSACMNSFSPQEPYESSETSSVSDVPFISVPRSFSEMGSVSDGYSKSVLHQSMKNPSILVGW